MYHLFETRITFSESNIVDNTVVEQIYILKYGSYRAEKAIAGYRANIDSSDANTSSAHIVKSHEQTANRAFTAS